MGKQEHCKLLSVSQVAQGKVWFPPEMLPDPLTERCLVTETTLATLGQLCGVGVALFGLELGCDLRGKQK